MPLDFYHAAEHLWAIAHELYDKEDEARAWIEPLLHQLKHEGEAGILRSFHDLLELCATLEEGAANKIERTVRYFENHREHIHYREVESEGCPNGSGAVESTCGQFQDLFKRTGQF